MEQVLHTCSWGSPHLLEPGDEAWQTEGGALFCPHGEVPVAMLTPPETAAEAASACPRGRAFLMKPAVGEPGTRSSSAGTARPSGEEEGADCCLLKNPNPKQNQEHFSSPFSCRPTAFNHKPVRTYLQGGPQTAGAVSRRRALGTVRAKGEGL